MPVSVVASAPSKMTADAFQGHPKGPAGKHSPKCGLLGLVCLSIYSLEKKKKMAATEPYHDNLFSANTVVSCYLPFLIWHTGVCQIKSTSEKARIPIMALS